MQSLSTAKLGLISQQKRVDTIANNLANINTYGYKSSSVRFKDALYTTMRDPVQPQDGQDLQLGTGVLVSSITRSFAQGTPINTDVSLDVCLSGDGFFTILGDDGQLQYTRNGRFGISTEDGQQYLVNADGNYVLDDQLQKIVIPTDSTQLNINSDGALSLGQADPFAKMNIVSFANNAGLESVGNNCYRATIASGEPAASQAQVKQGALEGSNVDLAQEMTRLIRAQRSYSLAGKALSTIDEMQAIANNIGL